MATNLFIAGPYSNTYDSVSVGLTENGYEVRFRHELQLVNQSDLYGDTILDSIYRGGNCLLTFTCIEADKVLSKGMAWPYAAVSTATPAVPTQGFMGTIGTMTIGSNLAKATVLTRVTSGFVPNVLPNPPTGPASSPVSMTANKTALAEGSDIAYMLAPRLRTVPIVLRLYPYSVASPTGFAVGSYETWFTFV